jgi:hypothetical protein
LTKSGRAEERMTKRPQLRMRWEMEVSWGRGSRLLVIRQG